MIISSTSGHACEDTQHKYPYMYDGHLLRLKFSQNVYELRTMTDGHGTLQATHTSGLPGDTVTLTPVPDPKYTFTGYQSTGCTINGNTLTFGAQDCTAKANFYKPPEKVLIGSFSGYFNAPGYDNIIAMKPNIVGAVVQNYNLYKSACFGAWQQARSNAPTLYNFITTNSADIYTNASWNGNELTANPNTFSFNKATSASLELTRAFITLSATGRDANRKVNILFSQGGAWTYLKQNLSFTGTSAAVEIASTANKLNITGTPMISFSSNVPDSQAGIRFTGSAPYNTWSGNFYKYE